MVRHFNFIYILCTSKLARRVFVSPLQQVVVPRSSHLCPCFFNNILYSSNIRSELQAKQLFTLNTSETVFSNATAHERI